jgi:hypothetical protein
MSRRPIAWVIFLGFLALVGGAEFWVLGNVQSNMEFGDFGSS